MAAHAILERAKHTPTTNSERGVDSIHDGLS
jgi:hypothetical protein